MSDLDSIVGEIDKIMLEGEKSVVWEGEQLDSTSQTSPEDEPTMEEISSTVAGVVMEEFPAGGTPEMFGLALVEASIGAAEDLDTNPANILVGIVSFFQESIEAARTIAESYDEDGSYLGEEGCGDADEDDDLEDTSDDELEDEDEE
jgi:hypothetical protein